MRSWLEYIPFICITRLVRTLSHQRALACGRQLGKIGRFLQPGRYAIADRNLALACPEVSTAERRRIVRASFEHLGMALMEMVRLDLFRSMPDPERLFQLVDEENLSQALELGRGCLMLTGHVGAWESGTFYLPYRGYQVGFVAKPMKNHLIDVFFRRMREANGGYLIDSRKGPRRILKALRQNHVVCVLTDQHRRGSGSIVASFFDRPAHTTAVITRLAMKHQIPIVPAFAYRQPDGAYRIETRPWFQLEDSENEADIKANTDRLNRVIEDGIRQDLAQWFWVHRRWRPCCERDHA